MSERWRHMHTDLRDTLETLDRLCVNDPIAAATRASMHVHSPDAAIARALLAYSHTVAELREELRRLRDHGPAPVVLVLGGEVAS